MIAVTKLIAHKKLHEPILVMVLKSRSNKIRSNEICIRRLLPVYQNRVTCKMSMWHTGMFGNYKILDEQVCQSLDIGASSGTTL